ncbi:major histocompatibility complex class I-related gene protein-like [Protopterus annectens]|uniref:major histocompatibility complex class I-related gene protein-like n=1 Tax=Protopterus annectens TaxID=7888 RepID=UPI001CFA607C|nr:major histocompatibility complex class I-related gene protein-like [Protopterus annectens]
MYQSCSRKSCLSRLFLQLMQNSVFCTDVCKPSFKVFSFLMLLGVAFIPGFSTGGSHSYHFSYTAVYGTSVSPEFVALGYVDHQLITKYESTNQRFEPSAKWVKDVVDKDFWDRNTENLKGTQQIFKSNLKHLMNRINRTGIHCFQLMYGCSLHDDGTTGGFRQYGFNGQDFIAFDKDTQTWTAAVPSAVITKNKWNAGTAYNMDRKGYLEHECIEWLQKFIRNGQFNLKQKVEPEANLTVKRDGDNTKLKCTVSGFYPRDIDVYFVKDKDKIETATTTGILPNSDGTYYIAKWIEIDPQNKNQYSCHVEHEHLKLNRKLDSESNVALIAGIIIAAAVAMILIAVIAVVIWKKQQNGHQEILQMEKTKMIEREEGTSQEYNTRPGLLVHTKNQDCIDTRL